MSDDDRDIDIESDVSREYLNFFCNKIPQGGVNKQKSHVDKLNVYFV